MWKITLASTLLLATSITAQRYDGQFWPCNPLKNATGACPPNRGLPTRTYSVDFTKQTSVPDNWTISNYATVGFGPQGAEFTFNKRWDSPQLWTDFHILFGKVTVVAQVANGTGMISSAVLISDVFDEIDFEMSGNNFGHPEWAAGKAQNNYFGKGITGNYDRGSYFDVSNPQRSFHTYTFDWSPTELKWIVDGKVVRSHLASNSDKTTHQYPQTPSKFQLGIWAGGDPSSNQGTREWAGGYTDLNGGPYTMWVKSVVIENAMPAWGYNYTDRSGDWKSIALLQQPQPVVDASTGSKSTSATSTSKSAISSTTSKSSASDTPSSSSVKPPTTATSSSKSVITVSSPTTKPSTTAASSSSKTATSSTSKSTVATLPASSTIKASKTASSAETPNASTTLAPGSTLIKLPIDDAATSTSTKCSSTSAISKQPTTISTSVLTKTTVVSSTTTINGSKSEVSYTTTTKCTTTAQPKSTGYKIRAGMAKSTGWAWNGWSNQWHGHRHAQNHRH